MLGTTFRVVLDACVLLPLSLCDTLLRAAHAGLYQAAWSEEILAEAERNLVSSLGLKPEAARRRMERMRTIFPEAMVRGYEHLTPAMQNHPKDRHVVAAATLVGAQVIVTSNLKDFKKKDLPPTLVAKSPDAFLLDLLDLDPDRMLQLLREQAAALKNPPVTLEKLLDGLSAVAPTFVATCREGLLGPEEEVAARAHAEVQEALQRLVQQESVDNFLRYLRALEALAKADPVWDRKLRADAAPHRAQLTRLMFQWAREPPSDTVRIVLTALLHTMGLDPALDVTRMSDEELVAVCERAVAGEGH